MHSMVTTKDIKMKHSLALILFITCFPAIARDVFVNGHTKSNGTYVNGYIRSSPNSDKSDNYGRKSYGSKSIYDRDSDNDGIKNQYDSDDDNDGINDNFDN